MFSYKCVPFPKQRNVINKKKKCHVTHLDTHSCCLVSTQEFIIKMIKNAYFS